MTSVQRIFKLFLKEVRVQKYINIMSYALMIGNFYYVTV